MGMKGFVKDQYSPGPSCSKLTMSLVNVSLKLIIKYGTYANFFAEKMYIFSAKITVN